MNSHESTESYLARGGKIKKLKEGESGICPLTGTPYKILERMQGYSHRGAMARKGYRARHGKG